MPAEFRKRSVRGVGHKALSGLPVRGKPLELFRHAAPELQDTLNAESILRILFSVKQEAALYSVRDSDELADCYDEEARNAYVSALIFPRT